MSTIVPTASTIEQEVLQFLADEVQVGSDDVTVTETTPLFDGLLDSLATLRLVVHLEETYNLTVADGELVPQNFESARRISQYVMRKITG